MGRFALNHPSDVTDGRAAEIRQLLVETVEREPENRRRRIRRRVGVWSPIVFVGIGAATVAGSAIVAASGVDDYAIVHCLESSERGPNGAFVEAQAALEQERIDGATIDDAVRICTEMWAQGALPLGGNAVDPSPGRHDVPPHLTPCVMPNGDAAVVPGKAEACGALGLAPFE